MTNREVVILSAVRTPLGKFGGALKDIPPTELAADVVRESVKRSGLSNSEIGNLVFGNVIHTDAKDMYFSRVAALHGGLPVETPALTLNRMCGSGLQAIVTAAGMISRGDSDTAVGGGAESMSRAPYWLSSMRWGARMNDAPALDVLVAALTDPFDAILTGRFKSQIVPVELKSRKGSTWFDTDESPRSDATMENLAKLKPAFDKDGTITAGNAS